MKVLVIRGDKRQITFMGIVSKLREVEKELISDVVESNIPFSQLAKKYGVSSRQAVFGFCDRRGIRRERKEHTERCPICQGLLQIARQEHSDFISLPTIKKQVKIKWNTLRNHIQTLRKRGLISQWFGRIRSIKVERAYEIYFREKLPIVVIGRQVGLKHFYPTIARHRVLGWDVPPPLFKYDSEYRRKINLKMNKERRRVGGG